MNVIAVASNKVENDNGNCGTVQNERFQISLFYLDKDIYGGGQNFGETLTIQNAALNTLTAYTEVKALQVVVSSSGEYIYAVLEADLLLRIETNIITAQGLGGFDSSLGAVFTDVNVDILYLKWDSVSDCAGSQNDCTEENASSLEAYEVHQM